MKLEIGKPAKYYLKPVQNLRIGGIQEDIVLDVTEDGRVLIKHEFDENSIMQTWIEKSAFDEADRLLNFIGELGCI